MKPISPTDGSGTVPSDPGSRSPDGPDSGALTADDVPALAAGAALFGTGGGGAVDATSIAVQQAVTDHGPVPLRPVASLTDDDAVIVMSAIGAPTVGIEMPLAAHQAATVVREVERITGRRVTAVMPAEIGGANGVAPAGYAARLGLALLDADGMGRAYPEATMISMNVAGVACDFSVLTDVVGNVAVLRPIDLRWLERHARALTVASGSLALGAHYLLTRETAPGAVIEGTVSQAVRVGAALLGSPDPVNEVAAMLNGAVLASGKVVDVARHTAGGFTRGSVTIEGTDDDRGRLLRVELQNENLVVLEDGAVVVSVPDLITIVDRETARAISTESLRYGQRVSILAWPCDPLWRTERGLELTGPAVFGYDIGYVPFCGRPAGAGPTAEAGS